MRIVRIQPTLASWQDASRRLLREGCTPDQVRWIEGAEATTLGEPDVLPGHATAGTFSVPRRFMHAAECVARHSHPSRWDLLYRILWRLVKDNRNLLDVESDPDVRELRRFEREVQSDAQASLFELTSAVPQGAPPAPRAAVPATPDLDEVRRAADACTACELYKNASQMVFGRGPSQAEVMFIGEAPGDQEDQQGAPFVGPAGEVFDRALKEAGIERGSVYVTNAVKHFKWEARGPRRIHQKPSTQEMQACRPWLEAELRIVRPNIVVCLGATAAQTLMGSQFRIMKSRGQMFRTRWAPWLMATIHPSAVLRAEQPEAAEATYRALVEDLKKVAAQMRGVGVP